MKNSRKVVVVYDDDTPLAILGIVLRDFLSGVGVPWLLSTEQALKHKRQFLELSPPVIEEMMSMCSRLVNYVHVDNKLSIRWLKWLGFTVEDPKPGELFHRFTMER
jgi:hypothetical protein